MLYNIVSFHSAFAKLCDCRISMINHSLIQLGWDSFFEKALADSGPQPDLAPARVIAEHRGQYRVAGPAGEMPAEVTGRMMFLAEDRLDYPVVGDWVTTQIFDNAQQAVIHGILPRKSLLARKSAGKKIEGQAIAANIDIIFIVIGLDNNFNLNRVERYLAVAAASRAEPIILLSKSDLSPDAGEKARVAGARTGGAPAWPVSSKTGEGMDRIRTSLAAGRTACFIGSSGVGKSSLINILANAELLKIAEVRESDSKGRHTTTHRELFVLDQGGIVIDTPGMRELGLWDSGEGIERAFTDLEAVASGCRFADCTHRSEPGCAVLDAVSAGVIDSGRYESFLKLGREQEHLEAKTDRFKQQEKKAQDKTIAKAIRDVLRKKGRKF